jgi:drug/metabolite transporter (DMT)-like permease
MAAMRNTASDMPVVTVNAYGMAYGAATLALIASLRGVPIVFELSWQYIVSLLYLSLAGTSLAFGLYLALLKKIGAARAAYTSVLFPVIALGVSTVFEGYRWSLTAFIGLAVLLAGNALALSRRARQSAT